MGRYDKAPVSHTCPMIDGVLDKVKEIYSNSEEFSKGELTYIETTMEKIRSHNSALREWGNELYDEKEELEKSFYELEQEKSKLESINEDLQDEIKRLEKIIDNQDIKIEHLQESLCNSAG